MRHILYPDEYLPSAYQIDYDKLYQKGCRGLIFDIDNTLVPHGEPADRRALDLFLHLKELGLDGVRYIFKAKKPSPKNYRQAMQWMGTDCDSTIFIGDQIFTDIVGAKLAGIHAILVEPINPKEEIQIVLKRYIEKIVLFFYRRSL